MSKSKKITLFIIGTLLAIVAICAAIVSFLLNANNKSRIESAASDALHMDVTVNGESTIHLFPGVGVMLKDVLIRNEGSELVSAKEVRLNIALLPLFHKKIQITKIVMTHASVSIERDKNGKYNFQRSNRDLETKPAIEIATILVAESALTYTDEKFGREFQATSCTMDMSQFQIAERSDAKLLRHLSAKAAVTCKEIKAKEFSAVDAKLSFDGKSGVFEVKPVAMTLFGGQGSGNIHADFSADSPRYQVHYVLSKFHVDDYFKDIAKKKVADGLMDFSATLSLQGRSADELRRSSQGEASLHGENLVLQTGDLDKKLSRYESSQNFNLVDVGAFFFVGPLGLAVTKGYEFAGLVQGSDGATEIRTVAAEWKIEHGVAQAQDVAMATKENRIVMKGGLNFVNRSFDDVTVAAVDEKGCPRIRQAIHGSFSKPEVEKPNIIAVLAGPTQRLLEKAKNLLGKKCEVFYTGALPAPPSK